MGGAVTPRLAAAVSNAGGLGILPLSWASPDEIASVVEETRQLTERPLGVNLGLEWDQRERLAAALAAGVRIVSFFWGDASGVIGEARDAGALVFVTVGTAGEGRAAAAAGADVVVAQGWEAGGHVWGTVSTLALVPRVVDAVAPVPVVAAGGIAERPRSRSRARARRRGRMGGDTLPRGGRGGNPPRLPRAHPRRRRGRHLLRHPLRPRLARCAAPHAPQLNRRGLGEGRPASARDAARRSGRAG